MKYHLAKFSPVLGFDQKLICAKFQVKRLEIEEEVFQKSCNPVFRFKQSNAGVPIGNWSDVYVKLNEWGFS